MTDTSAIVRRLAGPAIIAGVVALTILVGALPGLGLGLGAGLVAAFALTARRPAQVCPVSSDRAGELAAASALVARHGEDSIAPFILRPDKAFAFASGGVLAYRVLGRTAVVSGDPVAAPGRAPVVLASFLDAARERGWSVTLYGAAAAELVSYRRLGLRALRVGEEAVVRPADFSLEGRAVRKLRQSVHRVKRRGWHITACDGSAIDAATEAELDALEARWRASRPRLLGFAMSLGAFEGGVAPADLYLFARGPDGTLGASMRFIAHRGKLSLDTMRRVGETPNGLNEALVCRALEEARTRGVPEVSLNYAGLAHLVREPASGGWARRRLVALAMALLGRRFQMERLVRFNEKFSPEWRPRYLLYTSRRSLPTALLRVLQAEGYLPERAPRAARRSVRAVRRPSRASAAIR
jgi:lysyl-tRNA synthetase class 2